MVQFWLDLANVTPAEIAAAPDLDWPQDRKLMLPVPTLDVAIRDVPLEAWPDLVGMVVRWGHPWLATIIDCIEPRLAAAGLDETDRAEVADRLVFRIIQPQGEVLDCRRNTDAWVNLMAKGGGVRLLKSWHSAPFSRSELTDEGLQIGGGRFILRVERVVNLAPKPVPLQILCQVCRINPAIWTKSLGYAMDLCDDCM